MTDKPKLKEIQEKIRSGEMKVEMASESKVTDLTYDFVEKCLGYKRCLISDESYVSDFLGRKNLDAQYEEVVDKCWDIYNVDISQVVKDYYIVDIVRIIENGGEN